MSKGYEYDTKSGCIVQHAFCQVCDWQYENQKNALALGALHAKRTGHAVNVDIYNSVRFEPTDPLG